MLNQKLNLLAKKWHEPRAPLHSINGVVRKSSKHDPGELKKVIYNKSCGLLILHGFKPPHLLFDLILRVQTSSALFVLSHSANLNPNQTSPAHIFIIVGSNLST